MNNYLFKKIIGEPGVSFSILFLGVLVFVTISASYILPYSFNDQDLQNTLRSPDSHHWLGTDSLGRDMLSRLIYGARISLSIGLLTSFLALTIGTSYGIISGYFGKWIDLAMMRFIDFFYSLPEIIIMILFSLVFNSIPWLSGYTAFKTVLAICLALSILTWVGTARIVRGHVLRLKEMEFVEAARTLGANPWHITRLHLLPNLTGTLLVVLTYMIPTNIIYESFLSFIGLGLQPPYSSWGVMSSEGWRSLRSYPFLLVSPALALLFTTFCFNLLGDRLKEHLEPRNRKLV